MRLSAPMRMLSAITMVLIAMVVAPLLSGLGASGAKLDWGGTYTGNPASSGKSRTIV